MKARILAVEDTPSLRALLEAVLLRAGYVVTLAADGEEAATVYEKERFDAVVMDIQMPVLDGFGAAERMRALEKAAGLPAAPILALTANTDSTDLRRCLDAGFSATVRKPFSREELLAALDAALGGGRDAIEVAVDPEFADLVPRFLENARADAAAMGDAHARGDLASLAATAHRLVGAGASFGFAPLSEHARRAEAAAKSSDAAGAAAAVAELRSYLEKVKVVSA